MPKESPKKLSKTEPASSVTSLNQTSGSPISKLKPLPDDQVASPNTCSYSIPVEIAGKKSKSVEAVAITSAEAIAFAFNTISSVSPKVSRPSAPPSRFTPKCPAKVATPVKSIFRKPSVPSIPFSVASNSATMSKAISSPASFTPEVSIKIPSAKLKPNPIPIR